MHNLNRPQYEDEPDDNEYEYYHDDYLDDLDDLRDRDDDDDFLDDQEEDDFLPDESL